jgi:toxin ParE1/3/4
MTYPAEMTDQAKSEAEEAYRWISQDSVAQPTRWFNGLQRAVDSLSAFPARCKLAMDVDEFGREIRQLLSGSYRILFAISDDRVIVLHVRHGARRHLGESSADEP